MSDSIVCRVDDGRAYVLLTEYERVRKTMLQYRRALVGVVKSTDELTESLRKPLTADERAGLMRRSYVQINAHIDILCSEEKEDILADTLPMPLK